MSVREFHVREREKNRGWRNITLLFGYAFPTLERTMDFITMEKRDEYIFHPSQKTLEKLFGKCNESFGTI